MNSVMQNQSSLITKVLPLDEVKKVNILENNERMVELFDGDKVKLLRNHQFLIPLLRKTVRDRLFKAAENLPPGYKFLIITAYRPITMQKKLWRQRLWQMAKRHPFQMIFNFRAWRRNATKYTSPPGGSSHQCGAALDVTVLDRNNNRLDMGTSLTAFGEKCNTHTDLIGLEQKVNRKILYDAMIEGGFVNYPMEWWHYSYGDRMWAAYSKRDECYYGPLNQ
jgi:D-alanyl-D-alanine dipeptidase